MYAKQALYCQAVRTHQPPNEGNDGNSLPNAWCVMSRSGLCQLKVCIRKRGHRSRNS